MSRFTATTVLTRAIVRPICRKFRETHFIHDHNFLETITVDEGLISFHLGADNHHANNGKPIAPAILRRPMKLVNPYTREMHCRVGGSQLL